MLLADMRISPRRLSCSGKRCRRRHRNKSAWRPRVAGIISCECSLARFGDKPEGVLGMENDRIVVVTGGAGGIGSKIVDRFLANGDTIVEIDNRSDALNTLLQTRSAEDRLVALAGDVSNEADTRGFADAIRAKTGRVDVLINCAGYYPIVPFEKMKFEEWQQVIAIN